jgi:hypothetical protein
MANLKRKFSECLNCGTPLAPSHEYCPTCGQTNHDLNVPVRHFFEEAVEGMFHFDMKSVRTVLALSLKPGFVTSEFNKGKRVRYVAPVKMYVFISFIFFLVLSLRPGNHEAVSPEESPSPPMVVTFYSINSKDLRGLQQTKLDSVMQSHNIALTMVNKYLVRQLWRISTVGPEGFSHLLVKGASYMMFALMPLFALFVFLLNRKKTPYYIGTLIFSIHYHSFVFLLLTFFLLVNFLTKASLILVVPLLICPVYLYLALRYMYADSRVKTIGKTFLIGVLQFNSMAIVFLVTVVISILLF